MSSGIKGRLKSRMLTDEDISMFHDGTHSELADMLGARPVFNSTGQLEGFYFAVWAPNAQEISVVGQWNDWQCGRDMMQLIPQSGGIWEAYIEDLEAGQLYKYAIKHADGNIVYKADPCARFSELRPGTASCTWCDSYKWHDSVYRIKRSRSTYYNSPMVIYEAHLGSWIRRRDGSFYNYRELADRLSAYLSENGYTHLEIMPVCEHPYDGSWGYQVTGYFAPTSRYGTPEDFKYFVDTMHSKGIGVIMDWVPAHFPKDEQGLRLFDGTPLYEYPNSSMAEQKQWGTLQFDVSKNEVRSFLISSAVFWMDEYHIDGLRVDAVSCMLYRDYGRSQGEWSPNSQGDNRNLEGIEFFKKLNTEIFKRWPGALMVAEESSAYPMVTAPVHEGGLGFNFKWNMGWMNDTLKYMQTDPLFRSGCHSLMNFSMLYAFNENFILPISHDECVHGKKTLLDKMYGDYYQKFASLRTYLAYMYAHPGKKLLFMGSEFGQFAEWKYYEALEWFMLKYETHRDLYMFSRALNAFYKENKALWEQDCSWAGFEWINPDDASSSVYSFMRKGVKEGDIIIAAINFTPVARVDYWMGAPYAGEYEVVFNTDDKRWGGSGLLEEGRIFAAEKLPQDRQANRLHIHIPPMSALFLRPRKVEIEPVAEETEV